MVEGFNEIIFTAISTTFKIKRITGNDNCLLDNVSVKEVLDADFQFTRNSSATRVNSQGLIEDMQILSGDLVSNGDFSQEGSELVTNGDFATDSNWTKGTGWSIANGLAICDGTQVGNTNIYQSISLVVGKSYKVTYELSNVTFGSAKIVFGDTGGTLRSSSGIFTEYYTFVSGSNFYIQGNSTFNGSIDNVSVKEVGQDWTLVNNTGTSSEIINGYARIKTDGAYTQIDQSSVTTSAKSYKLQYTILESDGGNLGFVIEGNQTGIIPTTIGTHIYHFVAHSTSIVFKRRSGALDVKISNISVIEITEDTNLPRIDYTGGVGHWLFEPQSTNLIPYSEGFTEYSITANLDTPTIVSVKNPSGVNSAGLLNINNGVSASKFIYLAISTPSSIHTQSIFVKYVDRQWVQLLSGGTSHYANFDIQNGVVGNTSACSSTIEDYGNGWYRCTTTLDSAATPTNLAISVIDDNTATRLTASTGTGSYYLFGSQVEQGSYATSYIPTNGSGVTRLADAAFGAGSSDLINSTEGVLYAEIATLSQTGTFRQINLSNGTASSRIYISKRAENNNIEFRMDNPLGSLNFSFPLDTTSNFVKVAFRYGVNNFAVFINGVSKNVSPTGNTFSTGTLNNLEFSSPLNQPFYGKAKCVAVFKEALNNDELECLTGEGYETFNALALANNYTII